MAKVYTSEDASVCGRLLPHDKHTHIPHVDLSVIIGGIYVVNFVKYERLHRSLPTSANTLASSSIRGWSFSTASDPDYCPLDFSPMPGGRESSSSFAVLPDCVPLPVSSRNSLCIDRTNLSVGRSFESVPNGSASWDAAESTPKKVQALPEETR